MLKKIFFIAALFASTFAGHAQRVDSVAIYILQQTAATLQNFQSCRFTAHILYDVWNDELGYIKHTQTEQVSLTFPNKFAVNALGDKGHNALLYDGEMFTWYSYTKNQYAQVDYKGSLIQAIDTLYKSSNVEFPAADFFYPSFVSDILSTGGSLIYLGIIEAEGKPCFHIAGKDEAGTGFQFWISNDELFLPVRLSLIYKTTHGQPQYEATYADWQVNPENPSMLFRFSVPPGAQKVKIAHTPNQ